MRNYQSKVRVRYGETDQMGVVHHGNYAQYFELARIEWLEKNGISYKALEESGVMLPVYELSINYKKPAYFDDILSVETRLEKKPTVKIELTYEIKNSTGDLLTIGSTVLVFTDATTNRPIRCPKNVLAALGF